MAETTALNLYRSCRIEQFPDGVMIDDEPVPGVLHPDFYDRPLPNGGVREADIQVYLVKGVEWVGTRARHIAIRSSWGIHQARMVIFSHPRRHSDTRFAHRCKYGLQQTTQSDALSD